MHAISGRGDRAELTLDTSAATCRTDREPLNPHTSSPLHSLPAQPFIMVPPVVVTCTASLALLYSIARLQPHDVTFTGWELAVLCVATVVAATSLHVGVAARSREKLARQCGATLPPEMEGKWPAKVDLLHEFGQSWTRDWPGTYVDAQSRKLGSKTLNFRVFWTDRYLTSDHNIMKHMLTSNKFPIWGKGPEFHDWFDHFLGSGIFNSDPGDVWKWHRSLTRPHFEKSKISDLETFDRHADALIEYCSVKSKKGEAMDIQDLLGRFTLDSATEFLMGGSVDSLREADKTMTPSSNSTSFLAAFNELQNNAIFRSRYPGVWRVLEIFGSADKKPMTIVAPLVNRIIEDALARKSGNSCSVSDTEHATLVDFLVTKTSDLKAIRDEILNILLASRDTTASLLTSVMYMLCKNPEVYAKARAEVLSISGKSTPTYEDIKAMKYLRAILNETLRMFPPVAFNVRSPCEDDVLPGGIFIKSGTTLMYSIWTMQRSTELWGVDANDWDPTRWQSSERLKCMVEQPFIFQPFSAGPRICLGQNFAYNESTLALAKILQTFTSVQVARDVQPQNSYVQDQDDMILVQGQITLIWKGGMWVRFVKDQEK